MKVVSRLMAMACALFMLGVVFTACDDDNDPDVTLPEIGVNLKNPSNGWRTALGYYAQNSLNQSNVPYVLTTGKDAAQQRNQIEMAVKMGCKVLIIAPEDSKNTVTAEAINFAIKNRVAVVMSEDVPDAVTDYACLVKFDNRKVGENAGEYVAGKGAKNVVIFNIKQDLASSTPRVSGFKSKLGAGVNQKTYDLDMYTRMEGKKYAKIAMETDATIDAIYAQDDEVALGVMDAVKEMNNSSVKVVVGCGGAQSFFDMISSEQSVSLATTLYSPKTLMEKSVEAALGLLKGVQPEKTIVLEPTIVDSKNVNTYRDMASPY
ncbi:substrate-binding domain-containing protein [Parabacteroides sp. OttesenSCG-928-N08]|nr:substrate-binding domain-containing protein [Parabacteroides sp. OttesenSCG-928-N08]